MKRGAPVTDPDRQQAAATLALAHPRGCGRVLARLPLEAAGRDFLAARLAVLVLLDKLEALSDSGVGNPTAESPSAKEERFYD